MNTVTFEAVSEATGNYVVYNADSDAQFDDIAVRMLSADLPPFLLPVKIINTFGNRAVRYTTGNCHSITTIKMRMTKQECCELIYNMLYPIMCCSEWLLDYHKICFDKDYIFCDANNYIIKYVYIFDMDFCNTDGDIMNVIRGIFKNTEIIDDKDFRITLLQSLLDDDFSLNSFYEMICSKRKETGKSGIIKNPLGLNNSAQDIKGDNAPIVQSSDKDVFQRVQSKQNIIESAKSAISAVAQSTNPVSNSEALNIASSSEISFGEEDEDMENLFGGKKSSKNSKTSKITKNQKEKSNIFGSLFGKTKTPKSTASSQSAELVGIIEDDHTVISGMETDDETQVISGCLVLESSEFKDCPQSIPLTIKEGEAMSIGRKSANSAVRNADFEFSADFTKISRKHCSIRFDNDIYSICDLNSGNGTYVDGKKLEAGEWIELKDGSKIMFGSNVAVYFLQINS